MQREARGRESGGRLWTFVSRNWRMSQFQRSKKGRSKSPSNPIHIRSTAISLEGVNNISMLFHEFQTFG